MPGSYLTSGRAELEVSLSLEPGGRADVLAFPEQAEIPEGSVLSVTALVTCTDGADSLASEIRCTYHRPAGGQLEAVGPDTESYRQASRGAESWGIRSGAANNRLVISLRASVDAQTRVQARLRAMTRVV